MALVPRLETAVGRMVPECFNIASLRYLAKAGLRFLLHTDQRPNRGLGRRIGVGHLARIGALQRPVLTPSGTEQHLCPARSPA
jgi:hypothetical protein